MNSQLLTNGKRKNTARTNNTASWEYPARKHPSKNNRSTPRRRKRFKITQKAFKKNKGKAVAEIIDDTMKFDDEVDETTPTLDDLFEVYNPSPMKDPKAFQQSPKLTRIAPTTDLFRRTR